MARKQGWTLILRRETYSVRFRHEGRRYEISTRESDPRKASAAAARIYANVITGRVKKSANGALVHPSTPIEEPIADWIAAIASELGRGTDLTYEVYGRHWVSHFETIGEITSARIGDYQRARLGSVVRSTVVKERSAFKRFCSWLVEREILAELPDFPPLPRKALGTTAPGRRQKPSMVLTPAEVHAIIAQLPEWSSSIHVEPFPIRARFEVAHDTALRPRTLDLIEHRDVTLAGLHIRAEVDKNRWERVVPLSERARKALQRITPASVEPRALVFGQHQYRDQLRAAAVAVLGEARGKLVTPYMLKHARVTDWLDDGKSVLGIRFLTGTKLALDSYAHSSRRSAEQVIGGHLGDGAPTAEPASSAAKAQPPESFSAKERT